MKELDVRNSASQDEQGVSVYAATVTQDRLIKAVYNMPSKFSENDEKIATLESSEASDDKFLKKFQKIENVNIQDGNGWGFLHYAVVRNNMEIVDILLKSGVDVNLKDKDGVTPLYLAVYFERLEIVKKLLANGAKVNIVDNNGNHLLYIAKIKNNPELNKILYLENKERLIDIYKNEVIEKKMLMELQKRAKDIAFVVSLEKELNK